jgi:hypothetical protein
MPFHKCVLTLLIYGAAASASACHGLTESHHSFTTDSVPYRGVNVWRSMFGKPTGRPKWVRMRRHPFPILFLIG